MCPWLPTKVLCSLAKEESLVDRLSTWHLLASTSAPALELRSNRAARSVSQSVTIGVLVSALCGSVTALLLLIMQLCCKLLGLVHFEPMLPVLLLPILTVSDFDRLGRNRTATGMLYAADNAANKGDFQPRKKERSIQESAHKSILPTLTSTQRTPFLQKDIKQSNSHLP